MTKPTEAEIAAAAACLAGQDATYSLDPKSATRAARAMLEVAGRAREDIERTYGLPMKYDWRQRSITEGGTSVRLTPLMCNIVQALTDHSNQIVLWDRLIELAYGRNEPENARATITVTICMLRRRLRAAGIRDPILAVKWHGVKWEGCHPKPNEPQVAPRAWPYVGIMTDYAGGRT